jgi:hypothetical protein
MNEGLSLKQDDFTKSNDISVLLLAGFEHNNLFLFRQFRSAWLDVRMPEEICEDVATETG